MDHRLVALNRFGLGARIGEPDTMGDPREWLEAQLRPGSARLDGASLPSRREAGEALREVLEAQRSGDRDRIRPAQRRLGELLVRESQATLGRRIATEKPFLERLVAFWSNHLCVSVPAKQPLAALAGLYEREVIRPHVLGKFSDMVLASARHPAMLIYLDNFESLGPNSPAARQIARRRNRERGLNENYARELLELHTLGVNGGYDQADVEALARILTGWTLEGGPRDRNARSFGFVFRRLMHEPGTKTMLGSVYGPGGEDEGEAAIRDLCHHPSTARFVSLKLVRHFVSDEPPPAAVEQLARVFLETRGDLREVSLALVRLDEAWAPEHRKFRTPQDWVVAVFRAVRAEEVPEPVTAITRELRHQLWSPPSPKGYGDTTREWADPDALMNRAELARSLGRRAGRSSIDPRRFQEVVQVDADSPLPELLADTRIRPQERIALALGGPAFQWR